MTTTSIDPNTGLEESGAVQEETPSLSTFDAAVAKIMKETGCGERKAVRCVLFVGKMVDKARKGARMGTPGTHHLTDRQMARVGYGMMDLIMPHGKTAVPGSAHAAIESHLLGPNEYALVHDNPTGRPDDCVVKLSVRAVS